ncbi:MAG TPA: YfiR family protein [Kofleriaceae bacterium]|nr:YfiR family protein [Kofleriaceae bacterium]
MIRAALAVCVALACAAGTARAGDDADRRALVLLRVLSYDRNVASRAGDRVTILVVYDEPAVAERDRWLAALAGVGKITVADRAIEARTHAFRDAGRLEAAVREAHPAAIVVCGGLGRGLPELRAAARAHKAMTFTTREAEVEAGFSVGLVAGERRDVIAINLEAARAEGVQFEAGLLRIAKRIGKDAP